MRRLLPAVLLTTALSRPRARRRDRGDPHDQLRRLHGAALFVDTDGPLTERYARSACTSPARRRTTAARCSTSARSRCTGESAPNALAFNTGATYSPRGRRRPRGPETITLRHADLLRVDPRRADRGGTVRLTAFDGTTAGVHELPDLAVGAADPRRRRRAHHQPPARVQRHRDGVGRPDVVDLAGLRERRLRHPRQHAADGRRARRARQRPRPRRRSASPRRCSARRPTAPSTCAPTAASPTRRARASSASTRSTTARATAPATATTRP